MSFDRRVWPGFILLVWLGALSLFWLSFLQALGITFFFLALHMAFFRDPVRKPAGEGVLSPADGKIVEISVCDEPRFIRGKAVKIGIFLSVLDVHVNRMPWGGSVEWQQHMPGRFLDARDPRSSELNECNWIGINESGRRFAVRQISGLIARHIHSDVRVGQTLARGDKMGMICYGSRTEIYLPEGEFTPTVQLGDAVKSAETLIGSWKEKA